MTTPDQTTPAEGSATHYERPLLTTPFVARQAPFVETDQYIAWAGYRMADVFSNTEQEYFAIRNAASLLDITPICKYRVTGADAERYLNHLMTHDARKQRVDRVAYSVWCDDAGHVIDEATVYRFAQDEFHIYAGEGHLTWFTDSALGYQVSIDDITHTIAALTLQGPTSASILRRLGFTGIDEMKPLHMSRQTLKGRPITISRTGFTGDLGYELWVANEDAELLWDSLMEAGQSRGIRPIGFAALEIARIEAGHLLPEIDYISAADTVHVGRESTPFELSVDFAVAMDKGHFVGRRALVEKQANPRYRIVGLEIEDNKPATDALIYADQALSKQVGQVTSAAWSPTCKRNLAIARIDAPYFDGRQKFWTEIMVQRELKWEKRVVQAWIVDRPFFAPERYKLTPPADR
jgi:aminomethyltransferase